MKRLFFGLILIALCFCQGCATVDPVGEFERLQVPRIKMSQTELLDRNLNIKLLFDKPVGKLSALWDTVHPLDNFLGGSSNGIVIESKLARQYTVSLEIPEDRYELVYIRITWTSRTSGYPDETYFQVKSGKVKRLDL